jgi:hypothetical protein
LFHFVVIFFDFGTRFAGEVDISVQVVNIAGRKTTTNPIKVRIR